MFQKIFVPVDGSKQAEQAIPYAARIARTSHATILLVHVVVPLGIDYPIPFLFMQKSLDKAHDKAKEYLTRLAASLAVAGIHTEVKIFYERPAEQIIIAAQSEHADLVVMCSHGTQVSHAGQWVG